MKLLLRIACVMLTTRLLSAFVVPVTPSLRSDGSTSSSATALRSRSSDNADDAPAAAAASRRRSFVRNLLVVPAAIGGLFGGGGSLSRVANAADDNAEESFASIAARANLMSKDLGSASAPPPERRTSDKTVYDFSLPVEGNQVSFANLVRQDQASAEASGSQKVKAILVVNIKQDDPVARKTIPQLISLAAKYSGKGGTGALVVVACPTDQGYYEPDTSALIRLKLASEYGYGINPATIITDKTNLLGTGAHPFWRWLESNCRTPAGLGRVEGNFEKFLIDGETGYPVRRYPRKYLPVDMTDDIEAVIAGRQLPPARANYMEEWRVAAAEAERDTYRFEKGLNVFDQ